MKNLCLCIIGVLSMAFLYGQNEPVAVSDTASCIAMEMIEIEVLLNDYDPDGDDIEIRKVYNPEHGEREYNDTIVYYTASTYFGIDSMEYRIEDDEGLESEHAWIYVMISENPDVPVIVADTFDVLKLEPTVLNLLANDYDPNGDELIIAGVFGEFNNSEVVVSEDSTSVTITTDASNHSNASFRYSIKEKNTTTAYTTDIEWVKINIHENPDIPTAISDSVSNIGGETIMISPLLNDIDPLGNGLELVELINEPNHGAAQIIGNQIEYIAQLSANGNDNIGYVIRSVSNPYLFDNGIIRISNQLNPNCPVAVDDIDYGYCGDTIILSDILQNDYDPNNDDFRIKDVMVVSLPPLFQPHLETDGYVIHYLPEKGGMVINTDVIELAYRIEEVNNPDSYSQLATITINMEQNPDFPIFAKDTATAIGGRAVEIDFQANDQLNGYSPQYIYLLNGVHGFGDYNASSGKYVFRPFLRTNGSVPILYQGFELGKYWSFGGEIEVDVTPVPMYDSLTVNNINAGIRYDGHLFSEYSEIPNWIAFDFKPHFEYPIGSGKNTIFVNAFWIGGLDQNDSLHLAAQRFKQEGWDFQYGPIGDSYTGDEFFDQYARLWKLNTSDITYHKNNFWQEGYEPIDAIENWPGNGNTLNREVEQLAPYYDADQNDIYDPMAGDYPLIRGDQCILFILNDDRPHTETEGTPMGVEVHGMAYAYDNNADELLNNTIFVHYDIYNRSATTYYDTYVGAWTDFDIGYTWDDYVGSNVALGSYFGYNGVEIDGNGEPEAYGENPPAQSATIVAGPFMDADGVDNPTGGCDYSINGLNFNDGIVDNERFGLTRFIFHANTGGAQGDPNIASEYYQSFNGIWKDNTPVLFGGDGHVNGMAVGPECMFMFPGESDPCNWGTDGQMPNGGYNQAGKYWTEEEVGNDPYDRRGLGVSGPFTFEAGDVQELELAFSVGQGEDGPQSSIQNLFENLTSLFERVEDGEIIVPNEELSVNEIINPKIFIEIYPNPAIESINLKLDGLITTYEYLIYNNTGNVVLQGKANSSNTINVKNLKPGFYIIKAVFDNTTSSAKFVKF